MEEIILLIKGLFVIFYAFFLPGLSLSLLIYPKKEELDTWERVGLSFGLGIVIVPLTVYIWIIFGGSVSFWPVFIASTIWITVPLIIFWKKYPKEFDEWVSKCIPSKLKR